MVYCLVLSAVAVILDQISKIIVVNSIPEGHVIEVIKGIFNLTYIENKGAAFGMLADQRWIFMVISVLAIVGITVFLWKEKPESMWVKTTLAFILGGGVGNMIDRAFRPGVVDFIDADFVSYPVLSFEGGFSIHFEDFPIFNIADCFITVGCAVLIGYLLFVEFPKEAKKEKEAKLLANAEKESNSSNAEESAKTIDNDRE